MSKVFYRNPQQEYPRGLRGEGVYLYDTDGKQYLDGSGGAAVSCVGHLHPYVIAAIKRISKPSRRMYVRKDNIPQVRSGLGMAILSTSKGVLTDKEARKQEVGGEVICTIW